jgi:hypothetical protein
MEYAHSHIVPIGSHLVTGYRKIKADFGLNVRIQA